MKVDLLGRLRNISLAIRHCLSPLYEAISNSIDAIEDVTSCAGMIEIILYRNPQMRIDGDPCREPVVSIEVRDNGIGFTEPNFIAFLTSDTTYKQTKGGKGVGRFLWLKAFNGVRIKSVFEEAGKTWERKFDFNSTQTGIEHHEVTEVPSSRERVTSVLLENFKKQYEDECPRDANLICRRIIEHCLEHFLFEAPPKITLIDAASSARCELNEIYKRDFRPQTAPRSFTIGSEPFTMYDVLVNKPQEYAHQAHFCAHRRVVKSEALTGRIPHIDGALEDSTGNSFAYSAYVSGSFLDDRVDPDRTDFQIERKPSPMFPETVTWQELMGNVVKESTAFLQPFIQPVMEKAVERVKAYVETEAPIYKHLLSSQREAIEQISPKLPNQNLELELHRLHFEERHKLKQETAQYFAQEMQESISDWDAHSQKFRELFRRLNEMAKSELADYVIHRKAVLTFLENLLGRSDDGKYSKEEAIHEIIFPLRQTSDEVDYEKHNLWIIDERLVYHRYLASDIAFNKQSGSPLLVNSDGRPDLLIFNAAFALVESDYPFNGVTIVEFKRPERDDYTDDKNPINQMLRYVEQIREGKAKDKRGQTIQVSPGIPFYCYLIATVTPKLKEEASLSELSPTPDSGGYFGYKKHYGAYIEIVSFDKLVSDSKKRNKIFFDKLSIG